MKKLIKTNKTISYILITAILVQLLCGCGAGVQDASEETQSLRDAINALTTAKEKDNSLDAYEASLDELLQVEEPADAIEGGESGIFLGANRAYYFKKHLLENAEKSWDELMFTTVEGEKGQERFEQENRFWNVGPVVGSDHYIVLEIGRAHV